jgi:phosphoglycolate phosphatase
VSRFPLVLFDLDGTLVDSFADICAGIRAACGGIEIEATPALLHLATRGLPLEDFFLEATGAPPEGPRFDLFVDGYRGHYLARCTETTVPFPGVVELLRALRALPHPPAIAVATTKRTATAEKVLEGTGLRGFVDVVRGSDGLTPKPDPAVLRAAAGDAGVSIERAVMIGDTDRDVCAARAAGCTSIGVTYGGFSREEMLRLAPDFVVDAPTELLALLS